VHRSLPAIVSFSLCENISTVSYAASLPLPSCRQGCDRNLRHIAFGYPRSLHNLRIVMPRAESSPSNCTSPREVSRSPGTTTAHSRFSRNSFDLICHCAKDFDFPSPIWTMDQCLTSARAAALSGDGPDRMKWLFPYTRMPTKCFQASRRASGTG
jgi:hypothetical protein